MRVIIIGCGLIGHKRAKALGEATLVACIDTDIARAQSLAAQFPNCHAYQNLEASLKEIDFDIAIIAAIHCELFPIAHKIISLGKHIFLEKPGALNSEEIKLLIQATQQQNILAHVGYNHRYHRSFQKAKQLISDENAIGELMFIRAHYGHGGRIGYEKEWRANPALSGGGELMDQGVHLIDLSRWLLGDFNHITGSAHTYYWDMPVDDNTFLLLKTPQNKVAFLHVSCTEWKNTFHFEVYGKSGKIVIDGLGGSYGTERLTYYKMLPAMGPPETTIWEYPMQDNSWVIEFDEFMNDIQNHQLSGPSLQDAAAVLKVVEQIYEVMPA